MAVTWNRVSEADEAGWRAEAACRHTDANLFFPIGGNADALDQTETALAFCGSCPVQHACLQFALETNQEDGIWGGKEEAERRRLRRGWRQTRRLTDRSVRA